MIAPLTPNTQAILLLTAPLLTGKGEASRDLLSWGDYNRLARNLREKQKQPGDLIGPEAKQVMDACAHVFGRSRIEALLARGFQLSQAVERWNARAIWVISRADSKYPRRLKSRLKEDAPPVIYGCGELSLLDKGGLAVVGSRHVDDDLIRYAENVGRLAAEAHRSIVSGAAKGIDQAAMHGALAADGFVAGVMADGLERAALARDNRESLMGGRLVLVSPYDPGAGFNVGHAMQRNKFIYALADAALVVNADFEKGGTWTGAIEQLERLHFVPVFVRNGTDMPKGNAVLIQRGAKPWPNPRNSDELEEAMSAAAASVAAEPKQDSLPLMAREEAAEFETDSELRPIAQYAGKSAPEFSATASEASAELLKTVRKILGRELVTAQSVDEVAQMLSVTKPQAKAWVSQLTEEGALEKLKKSKPPRYRASDTAGRLL